MVEGTKVEGIKGIRITPVASSGIAPFDVIGEVGYKDFGGTEYKDADNCGRIYYCKGSSYMAANVELLKECGNILKNKFNIGQRIKSKICRPFAAGRYEPPSNINVGDIFDVCEITTKNGKLIYVCGQYNGFEFEEHEIVDEGETICL